MIKNTAGQKIGAQLITAADGTAFTGSVTVSVTGDAGTQATGSVGAGACAHEGNGYHTYAPAQAETNYDLIAFTFTGSGAIPTTLQIFTVAGDAFTRLGAPVGASTSADVAAIKAVLPAALVGGRIDASMGAIATGIIAAGSFAANALDAVWSTTTRVLTAATNLTTALATPTNITAGTIGSVTGAVGSVTGNVGGNVTGSVGSIATGGIVAGSFAANAITAASIAADAITDAKVAADVTIASVTGSVGSVTGAVGSVTGAVGSVTGNVGGNVVGSVGSLTTNNDKTGYAIGVGGIGATAFAANAITAAALATDAVDEILDDTIGDGSITVRQALKLAVAALGGKVSGAGTASITIRNIADTTNVVVAAVDGAGNRTSTTVTL